MGAVPSPFFFWKNIWHKHSFENIFGEIFFEIIFDENSFFNYIFGDFFYKYFVIFLVNLDSLHFCMRKYLRVMQKGIAIMFILQKYVFIIPASSLITGKTNKIYLVQDLISGLKDTC